MVTRLYCRFVFDFFSLPDRISLPWFPTHATISTPVVYEDQVHIKGRQFEASDKTSKYWFSNYQVVVPIK